MENDISKEELLRGFIEDLYEEGSLELAEWWRQYREWEQGEKGEFPDNPTTIRDNRLLVQSRLPTQPSDPEHDPQRITD